MTPAVRWLGSRLLAWFGYDPVRIGYDLLLFRRGVDQRLNVLRRSSLSSFLELSDFGRERLGRLAEVDRTEPVERRRFDSVADRIAGLGPSSRIFLKTDTQGADLEVFRGLGTWRDRVIGLLSEMTLLPIYEGVPPLPEMLAEYRRHGLETSRRFRSPAIGGRCASSSTTGC